MANKETDKNIISSSDDKQVSSPIFETIKRPASEKAETSETIGLLMDVELELTAQLGSCELPLKNILDFTKGSIIELDTYTSNPIDLLANGKVIARGEVVIIEDNFGLRVTDVYKEGEEKNQEKDR